MFTRLICALLILCVFPPVLAAEWVHQRHYDDIRDVYHDSASITLDDGHYLIVYQEDGKSQITMAFGQPSDAVSPINSDTMPVMRVDTNEPLNHDDLRTFEEVGFKGYHFAPDAYSTFFPDKSGLLEGRGFLYELVTGTEVQVLYMTLDGAEHRVSFPLLGSRIAMTQALEVDSLPSPAEAARNQQLVSLVGQHMLNCAQRHSPHLEGVENPNQRALEMCLNMGNACGEIVADNPVDFHHCTETHRQQYGLCADYAEKNPTGDASTCVDLRLHQAFPNYEPYAIN